MSNVDYRALNASARPLVTATQLPLSDKKYILVMVAFFVALSIIDGILIPGILDRGSMRLSSLTPMLVVNAIIIVAMIDVYVQQKMHIAKGQWLLRFAEKNGLEMLYGA